MAVRRTDVLPADQLRRKARAARTPTLDSPVQCKGLACAVKIKSGNGGRAVSRIERDVTTALPIHSPRVYYLWSLRDRR